MASIRVDFDSYKLLYGSALPYAALVHAYKNCSCVGGIIFFQE